MRKFDAKLYAILLSKIEGKVLPIEAIQRHVEHLRQLDESEHLVLCGPFSNHPSGLVVLRAKDMEEAVSFAKRDPLVAEGFRTFEIREWMMANEANNYLG